MSQSNRFPPRAAPLTDGGYARDSAGRVREDERMSGNPAVHSSATEIPGVGHAGEGRCNLMALFVSGGEWKVPR